MARSIPFSFFAITRVQSFVYKSGMKDRFSSLGELGRWILDSTDREVANEWLDEGRRCDELYSQNAVVSIDYYHSLYPVLLREIYDPPLVLFCIGNVEHLALDWDAIVGTRKASPVSIFATKKLVATNACNIKAVVSGMALGIDREAMEASLDNNLPTLGVLGTAVHMEYPIGNRSLYNRMKSSNNGLLISELLPYDNYAKWTFPKRNRIITGISSRVFLMEAPSKSGAMSSAHSAISQNKDLYIFDHELQSRNDGGKSLILDGANELTLVDILKEGKIEHIFQQGVSKNREESELEKLSKLKKMEGLGRAQNLGNGYYYIF